ncbi:putative hydrolase [Selenomonas ruminantium subsp. lactilytica TAM6421]|uniref:Putative hydrolase n=1 Tax=Selenomonas ruminantium subsp. lactilytica (strain NBRC 103574 / TAM6421) TaxID=927704 RepID=I0GUC4_SELRL|nr:putative hydrolase [Selenomonas ruminantium subsp. lactilytica TAM6421]
MFAKFFEGIQCDLLLVMLAALVCALFRAVFIWRFAPDESRHDWRRIRGCFNYGFWWGLDFNAYVFLISMVLVSIPASFFPAYYEIANDIRAVGLVIYLLIIYLASWGNMIFYYHFHDVYNATVRLGRNADKNNLADIFFNQNNGGWIMAGIIPYGLVMYYSAQAACWLPKVPYPVLFADSWLQYGVNSVVFVLAVMTFYWLRYGGTLDHRKKPEWDEVPVYVKQDEFLGKMSMDALIALEIAFHNKLSDALRHTEAESREIMTKVFPAGLDWQRPWSKFVRRAGGAKITKPRKIFLLFAESHGQAPFDSLYDKLNLMEASKKFRQNPHTLAINNFLPGGMVSAPSLASILSGIYDADLELNESRAFWQGTTPLSMAVQLKKLGYHTAFWYGGSLNWGSLDHFIPTTGFDEYHGGPDICEPGAPRTWLGIYDHLFLKAAAENIEQAKKDRYEFHFLYTTSNHGPYNMPYDEYGADLDQIMPDVSDDMKKDKKTRRKMQGIWYADQALCKFVERMQEKYPDALFIVTGDHTTGLIPYEYGVTKRHAPSLREKVLTSFAMYHRELTPDMLAGNTIGGHLNILPTLMELLAPAGHEYYSLFPSLTEKIDHVVTPYCWLTEDSIGDYRNNTSQSLAVSSQMLPIEHEALFVAERDAYSEFSGYFIKHPELLINKQEKNIVLTN